MMSGLVIWFTGLPGAGKSTLAQAVYQELQRGGHPAQIIDGDVLRAGASADLGFSDADRAKQVERAAQAAVAVAQAGSIALVAVIAPAAQTRAAARRLIAPHRYVEIYLSTPLAVCRQRDPKGLYAQAAAGRLCGLTGVDAPYEPPSHPDLALDTAQHDLSQCVAQILDVIGMRTRSRSAQP
jgi:adenylyl-sulfate kinase